MGYPVEVKFLSYNYFFSGAKRISGESEGRKMLFTIFFPFSLSYVFVYSRNYTFYLPLNSSVIKTTNECLSRARAYAHFLNDVTFFHVLDITSLLFCWFKKV